MVRHMPPVRNLRPGHVVIYPNRGKAGSKLIKAIVTALLLVSAALILIVTIAAWSKLQGLKPVNIIWALLYVVMAFYVFRWNRGLLPLAAALAILMLILAVIAGLGAAGTSWFDRNHVGYAAPHSLFGGNWFGPDTIGALTLIIAPVQALLIFFSMQGFAQGWNVEQEVPEEEARRLQGGRGSTPPGSPAPAAA
jgi:lysylphosphatidylglycerol synthetase-like protein (DUF2156 family)